MKIKFFTIIALLLFTLLVSSCATPTESPSDIENQAAQTIVETSAPVDDTSGMTEDATEAMTEENTTPVVLFENEVYSVSRVANQYYINFAQGNTLNDGEPNPGLGEIKFNSVEEMKRVFLDGTLPPHHFDVLRSIFAYHNEDQNGIRIWNLDELYQAAYPDGVSETNISLTPHSIHFYNTEGCLSLLTEESYHSLYESNYHKYLEPGATILSQATGVYDETPCEIVEYMHPNRDAPYRDILLSVDKNGKQLQIKISYLLPSSSDENSVPENIPNHIIIFGQELGQYFEFSDYSIETAPTVEWLTSFGVTPYVDDTDHVVS